MGSRRLPSCQRAILALLRNHPTRTLSYDEMSALTGFDRRTVITAVRCLNLSHQVEVTRGHGATPNSYQLAAA